MCVYRKQNTQYKFTYRGEKFITKCALGTETLWLQSHILLGLRIERGIINKTVDEYPQVILDLKRLNGHASFIFLLQRFDQLFDY